MLPAVLQHLADANSRNFQAFDPHGNRTRRSSSTAAFQLLGLDNDAFSFQHTDGVMFVLLRVSSDPFFAAALSCFVDGQAIHSACMPMTRELIDRTTAFAFVTRSR